ncbi:MAG: gephyrin-like molybdotransferase Glp [Bacteroidota bacterium]
MVLFEEALAIVLSQKATPACVRVSLGASTGRVLAEGIFSDMAMPPFDKSAVDGYACRMEDIVPGQPQEGIPGSRGCDDWKSATLAVIEIIPAGKVPAKKVGPGECSKIMTGAMVPQGADCVVMVEDSEEPASGRVRFTRFSPAKNICYKGEDIRPGDPVLEKGTKIAPAQVAVLASVGAANPLVFNQPRVGIISTGDELVEPSMIPGPAQIRNSNGWQLEAQVRSVPATADYIGIAPDDGPGLRSVIDRAFVENDVVLLSGGVSMGEFDHVPGILREAGVEILFEKIAVQPGKPTVFGRKGDKFVFGLPGNPVSSFVLFEMLVRPFLLKMMGHTEHTPDLLLRMGVDFSRRKSERKSLIPVQIREGAVFPVEYHGSAHIHAYTKANAVLVVPIGTTAINKGDQVHVRPI